MVVKELPINHSEQH